MIKDGHVVVFQQFLVEKPGAGYELRPHPVPFQTYPVARFQKQYAKRPKDKLNGFGQLGLHVTLLHDPSGEALEPEEDYDLPEGGLAPVAPNSEDETIQKTIQAIENGTGLSEAELKSKRSEVVQNGEAGNGETQSITEEQLADEAAEQEKIHEEATADSTEEVAKLEGEKEPEAATKKAKK